MTTLSSPSALQTPRCSLRSGKPAAAGAARSPESTRVLAAVGATRQKYSRPRPVSGQYLPVLRGGGTAAYGGIRPVPEHLTWKTK